MVKKYKSKNFSAKYYNVDVEKFKEWAEKNNVVSKKFNKIRRYELDSTKIVLDNITKRVMKLTKNKCTKDIKINKEFWCNNSKNISELLFFKKGKKNYKIAGFCKGESHISVHRPKDNWNKTHDILLRKLRDQKSENSEVDNCRKVRIYPNKEQRILFEKCFNINRYFYNKCVEYGNTNYTNRVTEINNLSKEGCIHFIKNNKKIKVQCKNKKCNDNKYFCKKHEDKNIDWKITTSHITLREKLMTNDDNLTVEEKWQAEVPYDVRQLSIKNYGQSYKSALALKRKGLIKTFKLKFKSRKDMKHTFHVNKGAINKNGKIFVRRLKDKGKLKTKNNKSIKATRDFTMLLTKPGLYYICLPRKCKVVKSIAKQTIVSLDPGVRTFQTFYSPDGLCGKLGDNTIKRIKVYSKRIDELNSVKANKKKLNENTRGVDRRCCLLRNKIKNIVNDIHWKTASLLCKNFHVILLPVFSVSEMIKKTNKERKRPLRKSTVRAMLSLSFHKFRMRLTYKASTFSNVKVITCNESFTSKTCGLCGKIDHKLGSSKIYNCKDCKIPIDRDLHAARNIMLKYLSK